MLDQLLNLVKENAQDSIVKNDAIPNQHNEAAISETGNVIKNVLGGAVQDGNIQDVMSLFGNSQGLRSNPLVGNIISQLSNNLGSKFGVDAGKAKTIASSLIPMVLNRFTQKTNDPGDSSLNINDIMGSLSGGKTGGVDFGSMVSKMQSGESVDFGGLASKLTGGKGIADTIGGLFK